MAIFKVGLNTKMTNEQKGKSFNRRDLLKIIGFSSAVLLSSCVSKSNNTSDSGVNLQPKSTTNIPSTETDSTQIIKNEPSEESEATSTSTDTPTEIPLTFEEELAIIQQPLDISPLAKDEWKKFPIIPTRLSQRMLRLFALGQQVGRDARIFSVVGDCQTIPSYFLGNFDSTSTNPRYYLGETNAYLQETIDYYKGSFKGGVATKGGQNVAAVFSPFWVQAEDAALCEASEGPLACELRLRNSVFTFISLEENWDGDVAGYSLTLEKVILYTLAQGVIPILGTKASNLEGDHSVNQAIVEIARRYEIPLWNFWASLQELPQQGLDDDRFHLTFYQDSKIGLDTRFDFRESTGIDTGWGMRNLSALNFLEFMRKSLVQEIGLGHQLAFVLEQWIMNG